MKRNREFLVIFRLAIALISTAAQFPVLAQAVLKTSPDLPSGPFIKGPDYPKLNTEANSFAWHGLLEDYKAFGLPEPPATAELVLFVRSIHPAIKDGHYLAFLVLEAEGTNPPLLQVGVEYFRPDPTYLLPAEKKSYGIVNGKVVPYSGENPNIQPIQRLEQAPDAVWMDAPLHHNACLATAIQLKMRQEEFLSTRLLAYSLSVTGFVAFDCRSPFTQPLEWRPQQKLALLAWTYWQNRILDATTNEWQRALPFIQTILKRQPTLATSDRTNLIHSLQLAQMPMPTATNKLQQLIQQLRFDTRSNDCCCPDGPLTLDEQIFAFGFDAVKALTGCLDDKALTRSTIRDEGSLFNSGIWGRDQRPNRHLLMCQVADELLNTLMCRTSAVKSKGALLTTREVFNWLRATEAEGERNFYFKHAETNDAAKAVLTEKYPETLPGLFEHALAGNPYGIRPWIQAIVRSRLPPEKKQALLLVQAQHTDLIKRRYILEGILQVDRAAFIQETVKTLETLTGAPGGSYWTCPEAGYTHLVMKTDAAEIWSALKRYAQRADVGLRMELMNPINYTYVGQRQLPQRLSFLASFMDDHSLRERSKDSVKFAGPCAGFTFDKITVSQLAAEKLASLLNVPAVPRPDWSESQWAQFRLGVLAAYKKQMGKE